MRIHRPFVRLPIAVDAAVLGAEVDALPESAWRPHPEGAPGNTAMPLVAVNGDPEDDGVKGIMRPTPHLAQMPYTTRVLASLGSVIGRTRLMRIEEETELEAHVDTNYYWWEHLRVHVPVHTTPDVQFQCGPEIVHMDAGEVWVFDTWRRHRVDNPANASRTHLVIDTVGSEPLWRMINEPDRAPVVVDPNDPTEALVITEVVNHSVVMPPWEMAHTVEELLDQLTTTKPETAAKLDLALTPIVHGWRSAWAVHADRKDGWPTYIALRDRARSAIDQLHDDAALPNGIGIRRALVQLVFDASLNPDLATNGAGRPRVDLAAAPVPAQARRAQRPAAKIERPIIVVSPPRSGSTLLFETLARASSLYTIGGESHAIIEGIRGLHPRARDWESNRLPSAAATPEVVAALQASFGANLKNAAGNPPPDASPVRLLEKTPKNALRVPFLAETFRDATFVYLYRDPRESVSSMLDAWRSGKFVTYPELPGWEGPKWSMLLTPGWRDLIGKELAEIVTTQWAVTTTMLLDDLERVGPARWCVASYDRLVTEPQAEMERIAEFCDFEWDVELPESLPLARHTLDSPHPDKWKRNADELEPEWERVREVAIRAHEVFAAPPRIRPHHPPASATAPEIAPPTVAEGEGDPLRSVHTNSLVELLTGLGSSLLVSTYQSGHLVSFRVVDGALNTHFRRFPSPMGIARSAQQLAVGTKQQIVIFQNQPAIAKRLEPADRHDACFVPRAMHMTGDIRVHDLAYAGDELWMVNTRFSCLATLDGTHSFVPRWRPSFVTALAPQDRCHLNGLAVVDGTPKYVTALGMTDEPGGWREKKTEGGVVLDVESGEPVATGLCMPHSPRWRDGKLWILQSGSGTLGTVDLDTGKVDEVAQLPGFTRGLAFAGPFAFIGLSQVREHVFEGLPLTEEGVERTSGVWVVDTRSAQIVAFLRFEGNVREVYEVAVLDGIRVPEIAEVGANVLDTAFVLPSEALEAVPEDMRS